MTDIQCIAIVICLAGISLNLQNIHRELKKMNERR